MKALVVSTSFPKKPGDSLSPFLWEYCLNLRQRGIEVIALVPHHKGLPTEATYEGIRIKRFKYLPEPFEDLAYSGGLLPGLKSSPTKGLKIPFFVLSMYRQTLDLIKLEKVDIVNFHWLFPACFWLGMLERQSSAPIVLTGHGTDILLALKKPFRYFAVKALTKSSAITVNSEYMRRLLLPLARTAMIEVIPMGVDTANFSPSGRDPGGVKKILFVGRLIAQKGAEILLDAFREVLSEIPDAVLEIIGEGPEQRHLTARAMDLEIGENVVFSGSIDYLSLPEKYRSASTLALPSLIPEGLGMTAVEAGACGVPTVTFGFGGTSEFVINEKTGLVVDNDKNALAVGLARLLREDALTRRLGDNARRTVLEKYSWEVVSGKFACLFESLTGHQKK